LNRYIPIFSMLFLPYISTNCRHHYLPTIVLANSTAQSFPCSPYAAYQKTDGIISSPQLCSPTPQHNSFHALGWLHVSKGLGPFYAHNCARQRHSTILSMLSVRCIRTKGWERFMAIIVLGNATARLFRSSRCAGC